LRKKNCIILFILLILIIAAVLGYYSRNYVIFKIAEKTILKEGQPLVFGDYTVFINKIRGSELSGIKISNGEFKLEAERGRYVYIETENALRIELREGTIEGLGEDQTMLSARMTFKQYSIKLKLK